MELRSLFAMIWVPLSCVLLRRARRMALRRVGSWPWRRWRRASPELQRLGSAAWIVRPCGAHSAVLRTVHRFNAEGPEGLINRASPGAPAKLNEAQRAWLAEIVERGLIPAVDGVVRWRA